MAINRRSKIRKVVRWLAAVLLLADVAAAGALSPAPDVPLWADLARICSGGPGSESGVPPASHDLCVFCLPLMGGGVLAPDAVAVPGPPSPFAAAYGRDHRACLLPAAAAAHPARGPPSA